MKRFDAAVIGGGILGCFAARSLTKYRLSVVLIESAEDVCTGISRANTAVVYAGYDHHPGSLKAQMTVQANASFDRLCGALDVAFSRCGSLMTACGPRGEAVLNKKLEQGRRNGVPGLRLLSGAEHFSESAGQALRTLFNGREGFKIIVIAAFVKAA